MVYWRTDTPSINSTGAGFMLHPQTIAELQEEQNFTDDCLESYKQAAELFEGEDAT